MFFLYFTLIIFLLNKVRPAALSEPTHLKPVNIDQETIQKLLKGVYPATTTSGIDNKYNPVAGKESNLKIDHEELIQQPQSVYTQNYYNQNVNKQPHQQVPQNKEAVKQNIQNTREHIIPNQQMERHYPLNPYQQSIQKTSEQPLGQQIHQLEGHNLLNPYQQSIQKIPEQLVEQQMERHSSLNPNQQNIQVIPAQYLEQRIQQMERHNPLNPSYQQSPQKIPEQPLGPLMVRHNPLNPYQQIIHEIPAQPVGQKMGRHNPLNPYQQSIQEIPEQPSEQQMERHNSLNSYQQHKQVIPEQPVGQQMYRHNPLNPHKQTKQEIPEQPVGQQYLRKFPQTTKGTFEFKQSPIKIDSRHTRSNVYHNIPEENTSDPQTQKPFNNEQQGSSQHMTKQVQHQVDKLLQNIFKKPDKELFQNFMKNIPFANNDNVHKTVKEIHNEESVSPEKSGLYLPNEDRRYMSYQSNEQEQFQKPQLVFQQPSYNPNKYHTFFVPKTSETPTEDQLQRMRHIQTGPITVLPVAPSSSSSKYDSFEDA